VQIDSNGIQIGAVPLTEDEKKHHNLNVIAGFLGGSAALTLFFEFFFNISIADVFWWIAQPVRAEFANLVVSWVDNSHPLFFNVASTNKLNRFIFLSKGRYQTNSVLKVRPKNVFKIDDPSQKKVGLEHFVCKKRPMQCLIKK